MLLYTHDAWMLREANKFWSLNNKTIRVEGAATCIHFLTSVIPSRRLKHPTTVLYKISVTAT